MNDFISVVLGAIKSVWNFLTSYFKSEWAESQARAQYLQQQQEKQYIQSLMYDLAYDLFHVLHNRNYYFVRPLTAVADIRVTSYQKCANNRYVYIYELTKTTIAITAETILQQVKQDTNADIAQARHYLMSVYGTQAFMLTYPYLFHGIKVLGLLDTGTAIRIAVISNYMPQ